MVQTSMVNGHFGIIIKYISIKPIFSKDKKRQQKNLHIKKFLIIFLRNIL